MNKAVFFSILWAVAGLPVMAQRQADHQQPYRLAAYLQQFYDFSALPVYAGNTYAAQVSTYDRTGMNNDGFNGTYSFVRRNPDSSLVIFEQQGPGVINRIWTPTPTEDTLDFFIDDSARAAFSIRYIDLFTGKVFPFVAPLCANQLGGYYCYLPIPFGKFCKIVLRGKITRFHQVGYHLYPASTKVKSFSFQLDAEEKKALEQLRNTWSQEKLTARNLYTSSPITEIKKKHQPYTRNNHYNIPGQ
ncbi:DUF2961 domain-containing protein [Flavihumibacter fluvii]|uniref:DUF2961 domain-containing protein n=1 Tax=Flavihumibacter fluvii TaxID=2838157 RepID=UPI001BDE586E|nr:DUF2961 domain-containing protein [Flavihumibacter fluvii]ULQ54248.1 DUF2961 domain-containing protein [Flavihumibacter fluvii]